MGIEPAKLEEALYRLRIARDSIEGCFGGHTAQSELLYNAFRALKMCGLSHGSCDRIAIEEWGLPAVTWAKMRKVKPPSLGCYNNKIKQRYPKEFKYVPS